MTTTNAGAAKFLLDLFGPRTSAPVFVTSLANDKEQSDRYPPRQIITRDPKMIAAFAEKWDVKGRALYYCVSTIKPGANRRSKATLAELTGLHIDIDFKNTTASPKKVRAALERLRLKPHRINLSGHGIHGYWLFKNAIAATTENIARVEAALRHLADLLAGDSSVCEVARLMRVPGSHNSKNGDWLEVINVVSRKGGYTLKQLETWLAKAKKPLLARVNCEPDLNDINPYENYGNKQIIQPPLNVDACLDAMKFHGPDDTSVHRTQLRVTASLLSRGVPIDDVVAQVLEGTQRAISPTGVRWNWGKEERKIREELCEPWLKKHPEIIAVVEDTGTDARAPAPVLEKSKKKKLATARKRKSATDNLAAAKMADQGEEGVTIADFHAFGPKHQYFYAPTRELWVPETVNSCIDPIPLVNMNGKPLLDKNGNQKVMLPTRWLDKNKPVQQMTWAPGFPLIIRNRLVAQGGWIERKGNAVFNLYRPPPDDTMGGDPKKVKKWLDHVYYVFNKPDADHIIRWLAHRLQRPQEKINHALVLGSEDFGTGKDSVLEPVKRAIGHWNFEEIGAEQAVGRFNGFLKNVILRVNEARDLGNFDRFKFFDHMKAYTASPPDTLRIDEKHVGAYSVFNCVGTIITTNHRTDGIYLPPGDRRHHVAWSDKIASDFSDDYFPKLWKYYDKYGGARHVAAYLRQLDISHFDPKAPPPKTEAYWAIVNVGQAPEENELADVLDLLGNPEAVTIDRIRDKAVGDFEVWLRERKNFRTICHRLQTCGYIPVYNADVKSGVWIVNGVRQRVYARKELSPDAKLKAVKALVKMSSTSTG